MSRRARPFQVITPWIQAFEIVFHNVVEKPVDNRVYKFDKSAMDTLLDLFA
jgi:hypothetical protein